MNQPLQRFISQPAQATGGIPARGRWLGYFFA